MEYIANSNDLTSVANAIRTKGGTSAPLSFPSGFVSAIENIPTGGGGAEVEGKKHLYFYDYDGTVVESFTTAEALALTSLPENPSHAGLTAQGWNWSLADIKSYLTDYPDAIVNVGQMYITDDGKTRIYITLDDPDYLSPYLVIHAYNGQARIDWGDNTEPDTTSGDNSLKNIQHFYDTIGNYVITIEPINCTIGLFSPSNQVPGLLRIKSQSGAYAEMGSATYSSKITKIEIGSYVLYIYSCAFNKMPNLKSITIPNNVTGIDTYAFNNCYTLQSVTIPDGVTFIGNNAFNYCYSLSSVTIPDSVTNISNYAFASCYALQSITIPDSVTSIGSSMFQNCYLLQSVTIPDSVTSIGNYAFQSCYSLQSVTIPDSVTSIGSYAFNYCYSLQSVIIPDGVITINSSAFQGCYSLQSVTIPDSVTNITNYAFQSCFSLQSVTIPDGVTNIGNSAFSNCYLLQSITIPDDITSIGNSAFASCYALQSITIPDSVTSIGNYAFSSCYSLASVTIPDGITSIEASMFQSCISLLSAVIPSSVTSIGANTFNGCSCLSEYHFESVVPPTLVNTNAFSSINTTAIIYVPYSADHSILEAYKTATNWSTYASKMQEEPQE